jgi:hypothetical protein
LKQTLNPQFANNPRLLIYTEICAKTGAFLHRELIHLLIASDPQNFYHTLPISSPGYKRYKSLECHR